MKYAAAIEEFINRLFSAEREYHKAATKAADLDAEYKLARSVVYGEAKGATVKEKEAETDQKCHELYKQLVNADVEVTVYRAKMENLRTAISATQSMMSAEAKAHYVQDTMRQT